MELNNYEKIDELKEWYFDKTEKAKLVSLNSIDIVAIDIFAGLKMKFHGKN
jgi:hypothetical protein